MGLMEKIFFRNWPPPHASGMLFDLNLDLVTGALGQFFINGRVEKLKEGLGAPAHWKSWKYKQRWHYPERGVWFASSKEGILERINLIIRDEANYPICPGWKELWKPWAGSIRLGRGNSLSALTAKKEDFIKLVGEPDDRDDDPEGPEFYY
jgi:hypothetical protein